MINPFQALFSALRSLFNKHPTALPSNAWPTEYICAWSEGPGWLVNTKAKAELRQKEKPLQADLGRENADEAMDERARRMFGWKDDKPAPQAGAIASNASELARNADAARRQIAAKPDKLDPALMYRKWSAYLHQRPRRVTINGKCYDRKHDYDDQALSGLERLDSNAQYVSLTMRDVYGVSLEDIGHEIGVSQQAIANSCRNGRSNLPPPFAASEKW